MLPLTAVVTFFVMGVWALAEAMADARSLLDGGKVPLMKTGSDWKLSLEMFENRSRRKTSGS